MSVVCGLCGFGDSSDTMLGPVYRHNKRRLRHLSAHKNCLYFGSKLLRQTCRKINSSGTLALFFFAPDSIRKEINRVKQTLCCYCSKTRAGCTCVVCSKVIFKLLTNFLNQFQKKTNLFQTFHFRCGLAEKATFRFDTYQVICNSHRYVQPKPKQTRNSTCSICLEKVADCSDYDHLYCPICFFLFHRTCLSKWAYNAGTLHLSCPNCKNQDEFRKEIQRFGIEVPFKDASWELSGHFQLDEVYCGANFCLQPNRSFDDSCYTLKPLTCQLCSFKIHRLVGFQTIGLSLHLFIVFIFYFYRGCVEDEKSWLCPLCQPLPPSRLPTSPIRSRPSQTLESSANKVVVISREESNSIDNSTKLPKLPPLLPLNFPLAQEFNNGFSKNLTPTFDDEELMYEQLPSMSWVPSTADDDDDTDTDTVALLPTISTNVDFFSHNDTKDFQISHHRGITRTNRPPSPCLRIGNKRGIVRQVPSSPVLNYRRKF